MSTALATAPAVKAPPPPAAKSPLLAPADKDVFEKNCPIESLFPSPTNPRKHFNEQRLAELAKTIAGHGVLEPILARKLPGQAKLEIVAGERRWRAAKIAKQASVPVIIRELTDKQALEIQTIENAQREDLHPLEQAEGYERLIKEFGYTPEKIADAIGKSRAHIFQIRKLNHLAPKLREYFVAGDMDTTLATVFARVPGQAMQEKAWQELKQEFRNGFNFRAAADFVRKNYMLDLARAPFPIADATLNEKAGACGACPKRTGNQPDLFPDVKNGNVCTDPACFSFKRAAHQARQVKKLEDKGMTVIVGEPAKRILPYEHSRLGAYNGYAGASEHCFDDPKRRTFGQLAKLAALDPIKIQSPHTGELLDAFPVTALKAALQKAGVSLGGRASSGDRENEAWQARQRAADRKHRLEVAVRRKIFEQTIAHSKGKLGKGELVAIASGYFGDIWHEFRKRVLQAFGWDKISPHGDGVRKKLATLSEKELARFLLALALVKGCSPNAGSGYTALVEAARRAGLKPEAIRRDLANQAKERLKPKLKAKAKVKAKKSPVRRQVASFLKPMTPSAALAAITGAKPLTRTEVTKKVWGHIKRHGLQDKKNRRFINADAKLVPIFGGRKRVSMFEMTVLLTKQLTRSK